MNEGGLVYASNNPAGTLDVPPDNMPRGTYALCGDCKSRQPVLEEYADYGGVVYHERIEQEDRRCSDCPTRLLDPVPVPTTRRRWGRGRKS
jgi:hypothetical protein